MGNLETKVTEELLFELFHQAGPVIKVKIPKDTDGKPKQFAFVNFKRKVSVPYAMNLLYESSFLEGPSKFRLDQEVTMPHRKSVCHIPSIVLEIQALLPHLLIGKKGAKMTPSAQIIQRSFSSSDNFQRQAVMDSVFRQMSHGGKFGSPYLDQSGFSPSVQSYNHTF